jgi:hypothetical protein
VVGPGRLKAIGGRRRVAEALALAALRCDPLAVLTPQVLDTLAVHPLALPTSRAWTRYPIRVVPLGEAPQVGPQLTVRVGVGRCVTLGETVLADDPRARRCERPIWD